MMFIANHLVLSEESSVRSMVGTTIHNLLIEISGFAGILESIEFAFYKCRKFSSMARLSLLSRPCSRCWNVFVVFQEAEFCL